MFRSLNSDLPLVWRGFSEVTMRGQTSRTVRWLLLIAICTVGVAALRRVLHGLMNAHYRPPGSQDTTFAISPAGDALVFTASGEGGRDLYLLDLKSFRASCIARTPEYEVDPSFSPDGRVIVYAAGIPGDRADHIYLRSLDGKVVKQLTAADANDSYPELSPDGAHIMFTRNSDYRWGGLAANWAMGGAIYLMNWDGSGARCISPAGETAIDPHFSPDGKEIVYWNLDGIFIVPTDGSSPKRHLSFSNGRQAVFSPDGKAIAFALGVYSSGSKIYCLHIYYERVDGIIDEHEVAFTSEECYHPVITRDGKRIIFVTDPRPSGFSEESKCVFWQVDIDGKNLHRLAGSP